MAAPPVGRSWHLNGWQTLLFALAALAIVSGAWFAWREARLAATSVGWVQHTFSVLIESDQLLAALADAEVGQRGYLLTGDVSYLQPYDQALPRVATRFEALRRATADVPSAQVRLAEIEPLVRGKLDELSETIQRARSGEPEAALALVRSGAGKELMDEIRRGIAEIRAQEQELLRQRIAARDAYLRGTRSYALIFGGLSLGVFGALIASINQTMGARRAAERSARASEQRLRVTLESIGDAVIATDVAGRVTYMNPVAEALTGWRRADAQDLPLALAQLREMRGELARVQHLAPASGAVREHALLPARESPAEELRIGVVGLEALHVDGHDVDIGEFARLERARGAVRQILVHVAEDEDHAAAGRDLVQVLGRQHQRAADVRVLRAHGGCREGVDARRQCQLLGIGLGRARVECHQGLDVLLLVALAVDADEQEGVAGDERRQHLALHDARDLGMLIGVGTRDVHQHGDGLAVLGDLAARHAGERSQQKNCALHDAVTSPRRSVVGRGRPRLVPPVRPRTACSMRSGMPM